MDDNPGFDTKVNGWLSALSGADAEPGETPDPSCEDAGDLEEEPEEIDLNELPELSKYRQALNQSAAYRWLLSSLWAQRGLEVPGGQQCIRTQIRRAMVAKLRPEKILSRQDPGEVQVRFSLDWDPRRFHKEQEYEVSLEQMLGKAVVLTGYGKEVQITTCSEYMAQVWPETGPALLRCLQQASRVTDSTSAPWVYKGRRQSQNDLVSFMLTDPRKQGHSLVGRLYVF